MYSARMKSGTRGFLLDFKRILMPIIRLGGGGFEIESWLWCCADVVVMFLMQLDAGGEVQNTIENGIKKEDKTRTDSAGEKRGQKRAQRARMEGQAARPSVVHSSRVLTRSQAPSLSTPNTGSTNESEATKDIGKIRFGEGTLDWKLPSTMHCTWLV